MGASYRKPEGETVHRVQLKHGWQDLPAQHDGPVPELPDWREWDILTIAWWNDLWKKPQAAMWQQDGSTLFPLACLMDDLISVRDGSAKVTGEIRAYEDRHGLSPKSMQQLLWRVAPESAAPAERSAPKASDAKARLKVVGSD
jgi:hypothetical protein